MASCGNRGKKTETEEEETVNKEAGLVDGGRNVKQFPFYEIDFYALNDKVDNTYGEDEYSVWISRDTD